jgi:hypothetical protein
MRRTAERQRIVRSGFATFDKEEAGRICTVAGRYKYVRWSAANVWFGICIRSDKEEAEGSASLPGADSDVR